MKTGVYSDRDIKKMIESGHLESTVEINQNEKGQIQPSSFDLTIGEHLFCMPYSTIPHTDMDTYLSSRNDYIVDLNKNTFLHPDTIYVAELNESLNLPERVAARANPKSSIGRIDTHVRLLTNQGKSFDEVREGYFGKLYLEICSNTFKLSVPPKTSFNQIRFFDSDVKPLNQEMLEYLVRGNDLLLDENGTSLNIENFLDNDSLFSTINLKGSIPGYVARKDAPKLDLSKRDLPLSQYFDKVGLVDEGVIINKDSFYLFGGSEVTKIPTDHCAEMRDIDTKSGEFRAHYAGFFDPNFTANPVLEVRNSGPPFLLRHGQRITSFIYFKLKSNPEEVYGEAKDSNYQGQTGVKPAKYFNEAA